MRAEQNGVRTTLSADLLVTLWPDMARGYLTGDGGTAYHNVALRERPALPGAPMNKDTEPSLREASNAALQAMCADVREGRISRDRLQNMRGKDLVSAYGKHATRNSLLRVQKIALRRLMT